ncbi:outer membrane beta-barrel protein [Undibacterium sp. Ren11W]|uniref:outer membrane beta-barrel protein n=1 Tax=Undibacterium sp. Ren11W TaxID=3413045 RepID=UPI003BF1FDE8
MKRITLAILGISYQLISFSANAAEHNSYVGAGLGQSYYKIDTGMKNESSRATGAKLFGGFEFSPYFAVEGGYARFGNATLKRGRLSLLANRTTVLEEATVETSAFYLATKATAPINDLFSVYGKLGVSRNSTLCFVVTSIQYSADRSSVTTNVAESTCNSTGLLAAFGADYNLSKNTAISIEYTSYGKIQSGLHLFDSSSDSSNAGMLSVNVRYSF